MAKSEGASAGSGSRQSPGAVRDRAWDEELVRRYLAGGPDEFGDLVVLCEDYVIAFLAGFLERSCDDADVLDLAQEVFVRVWKKRMQFKGNSTFRTWLTRISINEAYAYLRRRRMPVNADGSGSLEDLLGADPSCDPSESAGNNDIGKLLRSAVEGLAEEYRDVVVLKYFEGLTESEIAKYLRIPLGTVRSRTGGGLTALRRLMERSELQASSFSPQT